MDGIVAPAGGSATSDCRVIIFAFFLLSLYEETLYCVNVRFFHRAVSSALHSQPAHGWVVISLKILIDHKKIILLLLTASGMRLSATPPKLTVRYTRKSV